MPRAKSRPPSRLRHYRPVLDRVIFGVALLGILTSVHLYIQQGRGFDQGCFGFSAPAQVEQTFDCAVVTTSQASTLLGVSNTIWGLVFYALVAGLTATVAFSRGDRLRFLKSARTALIGGGFLYSAYLVYVQFFDVGELCALCLTSAGITTVLAGLQAADVMHVPPQEPGDPTRMTIRPIREAAYVGGLSVLLLGLIGADFAYFNRIDVAGPAVEPVIARSAPALPSPSPMPPAVSVDGCTYDTDRGPVQDFRALVNFFDPMTGASDASVTVIEYFDPNCVHCRTFHPVLKSVAETHGDRALFVFKPFVLWQHSIPQSEALYAAAQDGKFFEMLEWQYALQQPQTGLSEDQLRGIASEIDMNPDVLMQRIRSGIYRRTLMDQREAAVAAGVTGTPTVLINGRFVVGSASRTAECLRELIEHAAEQGR